MKNARQSPSVMPLGPRGYISSLQRHTFLFIESQCHAQLVEVPVPRRAVRRVRAAVAAFELLVVRRYARCDERAPVPHMGSGNVWVGDGLGYLGG